MIQSCLPQPLNEVPATHVRAMFEAAPKSYEGLPLYIGASVFVPVADFNLGGQRVNGVLCVAIKGLGKSEVFFQHNGFGRASRVRPGDCFFDAALAFKRFAHNDQLQTIGIDPDELLKAYMPPEPGHCSMVEVVA